MTDLARHLALGGAAALAACIGVYVVVSFALMQRHTQARGAKVALREALRESLWALLVQPLVPLFYLVGRRLGGRAGGVPVVLVHGYSQNRANFLRIAWALRAAGAGPLYGFNYPWWGRVQASAKRLARFIGEVRRETGAREVDVVCHSLGGVVALEHLSTTQHGVRRCVTIASPLAGIAWRGPILGACGGDLRAGSPLLRAQESRPLRIPCLSVYSTHDNVVHPPSTSALAHRGGRDHVVAHVPHLSLLFAPEVCSAVTGFLLAGDPSREAPAAATSHAEQAVAS